MAITDSKNTLRQWLDVNEAALGSHAVVILTEKAGVRAGILGDLQKVVGKHYVNQRVSTKRLAALGAPQTAKILRQHLPTTKKSRSGDLGEILATEIAEYHLGYSIPVRRLRWKDGRDMALRGDDIIGVGWDDKDKFFLLKGESKSRAALNARVVSEAAEALDRDKGRPSRHSVLFVADRLRETGKDDLALLLENAVLDGFRECKVEHFLFVLTGSSPGKLLTDHLDAYKRKRVRRHAVGVHIVDHATFIATVFAGI